MAFPAASVLYASARSSPKQFKSNTDLDTNGSAVGQRGEIGDGDMGDLREGFARDCAIYSCLIKTGAAKRHKKHKSKQ